jgi:sugar phosphate permease
MKSKFSILKKGIITRSILIVSLVSFFNDIGSEMLYPVMPVFLSSIGFSVLLIGLLEGFAEATAGLSKGYFGNLSDKTGRRVPFIRFGYMLSALSKPMMAAFTWAWWIFIARSTDRLGKGIRTSARDALLSDETTPENKGRVFGFHRALDTLGAAIGPNSRFTLSAFQARRIPASVCDCLPAGDCLGFAHFLSQRESKKRFLNLKTARDSLVF